MSFVYFEKLRSLEKKGFQQELLVEERGQLQVTLADGGIMESTCRIRTPIKIGTGRLQRVKFNIVRRLPCSMVLGMPWLKENNPAKNWETSEMTFTDGTKAQGVFTSEKANRPPVHLVSAKQIVKEYTRAAQQGWLATVRDQNSVKIGLLATTAGVQAQLTQEDIVQKMELDSLLDEYADVFAAPESPYSRELKHRIELINKDLPPDKTRQCRMYLAEQAEVKRQVGEMLEKGQISPSTSPYCHPVLFVMKKTGELRMCIDYRLLNKNTRVDRFPLPRIEDLLDKLAKARFFTKIDLANAYH